MEPFQIGDYVMAFYKTGKYAGEVTDSRPNGYLIRVLAVLKHPQQGDLHHPKEVDVPFFHERKALAYGEQAIMPASMVKPLEIALPDYNVSLRAAVDTMKENLAADDSAFGKRSLQALETIDQEFYRK